VGDGSNDVCPSLLLGPSDVVFARRGFALEKALQELQAAAEVGASAGGEAAGGETVAQQQAGEAGEAGAGSLGRREDGVEEGSSVRAAVVRWQGGGQILSWLEREWWQQ